MRLPPTIAICFRALEIVVTVETMTSAHWYRNFLVFQTIIMNCPILIFKNFYIKNSSIEFLCEQNFDFNKVFKKGISFISKDNEESIRQRVKTTMENRDKPKATLYPNNTNKDKDIKGQLDAIL